MEVVNLILRYNNHSERTTFTVTSLGKQKLILGHTWLWHHNPKIDSAKGEVRMSRCPPHCCPGCRYKAHQERIVQKMAKKWLDICSVSPLPKIDHHPNPNADYLDPNNIDSNLDPPSIEEGDHILVTGLLPPQSMDIRASSMIFQRLAEAHKVNLEAINLIPNYLKEFTLVFSKKSFDVLLEPREWDHAVELIPGSKSSNCKVYPLSPVKQKELNTFLKENLETGCI